MPFVPIELPPGIVKQATEYSNKGRWTDGNLVRWVNKKMQPVGGWLTVQAVPVTDADTQPVRSMFSWVDKINNRYTAMGSNDKLFAYFGDDPVDDVVDITPSDLQQGLVPGYGYGSKTYGTGRYGIRVGAPAEIKNHATWSFDNYGEDLLAVHSVDGRLLRWERGTVPVVEAAVVPNAPIDNQLVLVSEERFAVCFGAGGDGKRIEWSDQENIEEWIPTATNQAGGWNLQTTGTIVGAIKVRGGILIVTTTDAHLMRYIGPPFVYAFDHIGSNCGSFSSQTMVGAFDYAFWMGQDRFWLYDGTVRKLECDVLEHVFQRINRGRPFAFSAGANTRFNEVWFFYPTEGDLNPTEFVAFSYRDEPHWHIGKMERTAWHDNMVYNYPLAITPDGNLKFHEFGWLDDNAPRLAEIYAETAPIDIAQGEFNARIRKLFQDAFDPTNHPKFPYQVELRTRQGADGPSRVSGPYEADHERGYTDVRAQGRQVQVKVINNEDEFWELGTMRLDVAKGGRRGF